MIFNKVGADDNVDSDSEHGGKKIVSSQEWSGDLYDFATPLSCSTLSASELQSQSRLAMEYLKLEVVELKQLLIALASKYKVAEESRRKTDGRNKMLLQENIHLKAIATLAEQEKIQAIDENRCTLEKMKEFLEFKEQFQQQAAHLKRVLHHRPRQRSKSTSVTDLIVNYDEADKKKICCEKVPVGQGDIMVNTILEEATNTSNPEKLPDEDSSDKEMDAETCQSMSSQTRDETSKEGSSCSSLTQGPSPSSVKGNNHCKGQKNLGDKKNGASKKGVETCDQVDQKKSPRDSGSDEMNDKNCSISKLKSQLSRANHEILTLKNMNQWKTSELDNRTRELQVMKRELSESSREISKLKATLSKMSERPSRSRSAGKKIVDGTNKRAYPYHADCGSESKKLSSKVVTSNGSKPVNSTNKSSEINSFQCSLPMAVSPPPPPVSFSSGAIEPSTSDEMLERLWYLDELDLPCSKKPKDEQNSEIAV